MASLNSCSNPWIYLAFSESLMNHLRKLLVRIGFSCSRCNHVDLDDSPTLPHTLRGATHRSASEERRRQQRVHRRQDSIGAEDDGGEVGHFLAMDQLNRDMKVESCQQRTSAKIDGKRINDSERAVGERSKKSDGKENDERAHHRPSDPLLTTSTKFTGV